MPRCCSSSYGSSFDSLPPDALFLGFDSSTQSLKVTVIDAGLRLVKTAKVHYDTDLPHYGTKDGVHRDPHEPGRTTGPVCMWVEALDKMLDKLASEGFPFHKVVAISGSAQQHGSVYWARGTRDSILRNLDPSKSLLEQLQARAFATKASPNWMDSTTSAQCNAIEQALGGPAQVTALTGSRSLERYTGPQIRKIYETDAETYHATERVSLVSSFMASLLVGDYVAIDHSDAAGMTLMNLRDRTWSPEALNATAPGLRDKLGPLALPHSVAGQVHSYYVDRYKFNPSCQVVHWSGDNPCSLAGLAITRLGDIAISLGTGDTVFGVTNDSHPGLDGHVFPNPIDPNTYVAMLVHKNGSLSREEIKNRYANGSWESFNELLDSTPPLNEGKMGFYYKEWESLPPLPVGYHRYILGRSNENGHSNAYDAEEAKKVPHFDAAAEVRAIVEGQFVAMRAHAERIGLPCPPNRVIATGGGSTNKHLLALLASVFGCDVYTANCPDSAPLGAALRAAQGWICKKKGSFVPVTTLLEGASQETAFQCSLLAKKGSRELHEQYGQLAEVRVQIEQQLLAEINPRQAEIRLEIYQEQLDKKMQHEAMTLVPE